MIDILLYSHHLPAWYCIDIVKRNSFLVTCGSERVKLFLWIRFSVKTGPCSPQMISIISFVSYSAYTLTLQLSDQICNSPYYQPYNSFNFSFEKLVLDQLIIPYSLFSLLIWLTSYWFCKKESFFWSLMGVEGGKGMLPGKSVFPQFMWEFAEEKHG